MLFGASAAEHVPPLSSSGAFWMDFVNMGIKLDFDRRFAHTHIRLVKGFNDEF